MTTPKEPNWLLLAILLILAFSSVPNWVGYASETSYYSYKGIFFDPQDYAVHMSMLRAGMQGDWAYQFRFTTEPHQAAYTRLFYILLGQANRLFKLEPAALFEVARRFWTDRFVRRAKSKGLVLTHLVDNFPDLRASQCAIFYGHSAGDSGRASPDENHPARAGTKRIALVFCGPIKSPAHRAGNLADGEI